MGQGADALKKLRLMLMAQMEAFDDLSASVRGASRCKKYLKREFFLKKLCYIDLFF